MNKLVARKHKWSLEYTSKLGRGQNEMRQDGNRQFLETLPDPPGFSTLATNDLTHKESNPDLIEKKSWDIALGPLKQIPMNLFIMWMAGNSISIFPIMMVGMMFIRPIQALISIQQTFRMIEGKNSGIQKLVYTFGNLVGIGLAVYKCHVMGLLPLHASDWLAFIEPQQRSEWSCGGVVL